LEAPATQTRAGEPPTSVHIGGEHAPVLLQASAPAGGTVALLMAVATVLLLGGIVVLLRQHSDDQLQVIIGGLAGAATASASQLIRSGGLEAMNKTIARNGLVGVFMPLVAGLAAGGFSVLVAIGLFSVRTDHLSLTAGAIFGGIYGLLLGGWANTILGAQATGIDEATIVQAALGEVDRQVRLPPHHRYRGQVRAAIDTSGAGTLVAGVLRVGFGPAQPEPAAGPSPPNERWIVGAVQVDEGANTDLVPFDLTIIADSDVTAVPRARQVLVPAAEPSEIYEFTLTRDTATGPGDRPSVAVLLSVAQGGQTLQLIELPLALSG